MQINLHRQNNHGDTVVVGLYDDYKKILNILFSRTKDEFGGFIKIKEPILPESLILDDIKVITLIDMDFDDRYEVAVKTYKSKMGKTKGIYKGLLNFKVEDLKKVR